MICNLQCDAWSRTHRCDHSWYCRSADRSKLEPGLRNDNVGFRVCLLVDGDFKSKANPIEAVVPAEPKPGEEHVFDVGNGVKMTFCWIPGSNGKFTIGSPKAAMACSALFSTHASSTKFTPSSRLN